MIFQALSNDKTIVNGSFVNQLLIYFKNILVPSGSVTSSTNNTQAFENYSLWIKTIETLASALWLSLFDLADGILGTMTLQAYWSSNWDTFYVTLYGQFVSTSVHIIESTCSSGTSTILTRSLVRYTYIFALLWWKCFVHFTPFVQDVPETVGSNEWCVLIQILFWKRVVYLTNLNASTFGYYLPKRGFIWWHSFELWLQTQTSTRDQFYNVL